MPWRNCESDWSYWKDFELLPGADGVRTSLAPPTYYDSDAIVARLARSQASKGPMVEAQGPRLFAHAPAVPSITLPHARSLRVRYGISDGAWTGGRHTSGVCFRALGGAAGAAPQLLHERCMTPV